MIARVRRYFDNYGPAMAALNLTTLGWFAWVVARSARFSVGVVVIPTALAIVLVTYLLAGVMVREYHLVSRLLRAVALVFIVLLVLDMTNAVRLPRYTDPGMFFIAVFFVSSNFWIFSHRDFYTPRRWSRDEAAIGAQVDRWFDEHIGDEEPGPRAGA